jgi:hypothetical protein
LLGFPEHHRGARVCAAANKLKFNYLNGNLMVPEIHPFSLSYDFNSDKWKTKAANVSPIVNRNDGFDHTVICTITSVH